MIIDCFSQTDDLKFELVREFTPWGMESIDGPRYFYNGNHNQVFAFDDYYNYVATIYDLGEVNTTPSNPLNSKIETRQSCNFSSSTVGTLLENGLQWAHQRGATTFIHASKNDVNGGVISIWQTYLSEVPKLTNEIYPFDIDNWQLDFTNFCGFNLEGNLMFYHKDNVVFISPGGQYVSSLLNTNFSLYQVDINMFHPDIYILKDNKYLLVDKNSSKLVVVDASIKDTGQILLNKKYSSTPFHHFDYERGSSFLEGEGSFTFISSDGIYSIYLESGEINLDISNEEIGFSPENIRSLPDGNFLVSFEHDYALLEPGYNQKNILYLKAKGNFIYDNRIDDIHWPYILSTSFNDSNYQIYHCYIDKGLSTVGTSKKKFIGIYPNPVKSILTLNSEQAIDNITIYNIMGQEVASYKELTNNRINVSLFPNGFYIFER